MLKKLLSVALVLSMIFSLVLPVGAQTTALPEGLSQTILEDNTAPELQPRAFSRNYTKYLGSSIITLITDDNWYGERNLSVALTDAPANMEVMVSVFRTDTNGTVATRYVSLDNAVYFSIPPTGFSILVYKTVGSSGNATFSVSLS